MKVTIKKISTVLIGRTLYEILNYFFDYVLYPLVLLKFGFLNGLLLMIAITAIINFIMLISYSKMKIDWLGYDYIKKAKEYLDNKKGILKAIGNIINKSDIILFIVFSTFRDSFETTAYFNHSYKLTKGKTMSIFAASLIVGNLYWSVGVEVLINSWLQYLINI